MRVVSCPWVAKRAVALRGRSAGAADGESFDAHGRQADADRDALSVLAAHADARIELQVGTDERYAREGVRTVADERRALDRALDPAVLDPVGLGGGEHELATGDVDLASAEIHGVETALHRGND